jgi:hypothetical protein
MQGAIDNLANAASSGTGALGYIGGGGNVGYATTEMPGGKRRFVS